MNKPELKPRVRKKLLQFCGPDDEVLESKYIQIPHPRYKRSRSATKKLKKNSLKNKLNSPSTNKKGYDLFRVAKPKK